MTTKDQASAAREMRAKLDAHIAGVRDEMLKHEASLRDIDAQIARVRAEPVGAAALIARAHASIDAVAENYQRKIADSVGLALRKAPTVADMLEPYPPGGASLYIPLRGSSTFLGDYNDEPLTQEAATFLFREEMKQAAERAIRSAKLSDETLAGTDMADAEKRLSKLAAKRKDVAGKLEALREELRELTGDSSAG